MIGTINVFGVTATLTRGGRWACGEPALAAHLNSRFNPADEGPAGGAFGRGLVVRAAQALGVAYWLPPEPAAERDEFGPDVVY